MAEEKYVFPDDDDKEHNKNGAKSKLDGILQFVWNPRTKEFLGRDGASWAKVSLFYGIFYLLLGGFFIGMLAVFFALTPKDRPTYYGTSSIMNTRGLNPGLGFRPQIDPEDYLIKYNPILNLDESYGSRKYVDNLRIFLTEKYKAANQQELDDCSGLNNSTSDDLASNGKSCKFDYKKIYENSPCTAENSFGYNTPSPCILVKLNKIISWKPDTNNGYISIKCNGEHAFDVDNVRNFTYYSEDTAESNLEARIASKYFPYNGQTSYRSPFIWVKLNVAPNVLVNIECKAYANNIDIERLNRRGLTKFALYVQQKPLENSDL